PNEARFVLSADHDRDARVRAQDTSPSTSSAPEILRGSTARGDLANAPALKTHPSRISAKPASVPTVSGSDGESWPLPSPVTECARQRYNLYAQHTRGGRSSVGQSVGLWLRRSPVRARSLTPTIIRPGRRTDVLQCGHGLA